MDAFWGSPLSHDDRADRTDRTGRPARSFAVQWSRRNPGPDGSLIQPGILGSAGFLNNDTDPVLEALRNGRFTRLNGNRLAGSSEGADLQF